MPKSDKQFFIICHNIRSLLNVGSIFRTADAFGVAKIYLTGYTGTPGNIFHRMRMAKSSLGAESWMEWEYEKPPIKLIKQLQLDGVNIIALEKTKSATSLKKFQPKFPLALVLGEEVRGVSLAILKLCDNVVQI